MIVFVGSRCFVAAVSINGLTLFRCCCFCCCCWQLIHQREQLIDEDPIRFGKRRWRCFAGAVTVSLPLLLLFCCRYCCRSFAAAAVVIVAIAVAADRSTTVVAGIGDPESGTQKL